MDSFTDRKITQICSGQETINVLSPIIDVYRAADVLNKHPYVDGGRLAVLGFSMGGRATIWSAFTRFQSEYEGQPFAAYLAFYPSTCYLELADEETAGGPVRIFHGTEDNWTPLDQCEDMAQRFVSDGTDASIYAYPDAAHSFDNSIHAWAVNHYSPQALSPRSCSFVEIDGEIIDPDTGTVPGTGSTCVEKGVNYAYNPEARDAAEDDLIQLLNDTLQP